jgi:hypothetical protein
MRMVVRAKHLPRPPSFPYPCRFDDMEEFHCIKQVFSMISHDLQHFRRSFNHSVNGRLSLEYMHNAVIEDPAMQQA